MVDLAKLDSVDLAEVDSVDLAELDLVDSRNSVSEELDSSKAKQTLILTGEPHDLA